VCIVHAEHIVTTTYGRYAYLKSKHRASLLDDTVKAILLTQAFADALSDPVVPFTLSSKNR
jgi:hypothetical protein